MINQELVDYIKQRSSEGADKETLRQELLATGWTDDSISIAFSNAFDKDDGLGQNLKAPTALLSDSFRMYGQRFSSLIGIVSFYILLIIAGVIPENAPAPYLITATFLSTVGAALSIVSGWAIFSNLKEETDPGIIKPYLAAFRNFFSYAWITLLVVLAGLGGLLLFIIPGILLYVWLSFAVIVAIVEGNRGFDALLTSREYTRGRWWSVVGRFLYLSIFFWAAAFALLFLFPEGAARNIMLATIGIFFAPLGAIYSFLLYKDLKRVYVPSEKPAKRKTFVIFAVLGMAAIAALVWGLVWLMNWRNSIFELDPTVQQTPSDLELDRNSEAWSVVRAPLVDFWIPYPPHFFVSTPNGFRLGFSSYVILPDTDTPPEIGVSVFPGPSVEHITEIRSMFDTSVEGIEFIKTTEVLHIVGRLKPDIFGWGGSIHGYSIFEQLGHTIVLNYIAEDPEISEISQEMLRRMPLK